MQEITFESVLIVVAILIAIGFVGEALDLWTDHLIRRWFWPLTYYRRRIRSLERKIERRGDARSMRYIAERDALMAKAEKIDPNFRASLPQKRSFS